MMENQDSRFQGLENQDQRFQNMGELKQQEQLKRINPTAPVSLVQKKPLITIFLRSEENIDYEYSASETQLIIEHKYLLCGLLEEIKKDLLSVGENIQGRN